MPTTAERFAKLTQDVRVLSAATQKEAKSGSVEAAIMEAMGNVAVEMGKYLKSKYPKSFKGFSSKPYNAGHMMVGISSEINNAVEGGRPGDIAVEVQFKGGTTPTWVRVWAVFPNAKGYERELFFKPGMDPQSVAKALGPALQRDLDYWMTAVADAYAK